MFGFPLGMMSGGNLCVPDISGELEGMGDPGSMGDEGQSKAGGSAGRVTGSFDESYDEGCDTDEPSSAISDDFKDKLRDFEGMAATIRFADGAIELEAAGDAGLGSTVPLGGSTADVVESLPSDSGAVVALGFKEGWFGDIVDYVAPYAGEDADDLMSELSDMTGLDLPADAETLSGDSAALVLGGDFDPDAFFSSDDGSDIPVAVKIKGDPDKIEKVLDKLRDMAGPQANVLESDKDGDVIVVGPNADYRDEVLEDGGLGDNDVFKDVVRESDKAQGLVFVDVDVFEDAIEESMGDSDEEFFENFKQLSGIGAVAWVEDGVSHTVLRAATN